MLLASGLLMLILGATSTILLIAVDDLRAAARAAQGSEEVLATANELERLVIDLETGVRGFVLTGEDQFLEPGTGRAGASPPAPPRWSGSRPPIPSRSGWPGSSPWRRAPTSSSTRTPWWRRCGGATPPPAASP